MHQPVFAKGLLEQWGVRVDILPESTVPGKKQADLLAEFDGVRVLIEEKTKTDSEADLDARNASLRHGNVHATSMSVARNETLSGIVSKSARQLASSMTVQHDFRLLWFNATGIHAVAQFEQVIATLYGRANIFEMNGSHFRRCYYFHNADFHRRATVIDGAVITRTDGHSISLKLCLNSFSPRYSELKKSSLVAKFGNAVEDPGAMEAEGAAFILDSDLPRKDHQALLRYLEKKYSTGPLMHFDLGYLSAAVSVPT